MPPAAIPPALRDEILAVSPAMFRRVADFITREIGIKMTSAKLPLLQSRLQRRVRDLGCGTLEDYLELVVTDRAGEGERQQFVDAVTTNKTDFLREPQHFDFLTQKALPSLDPGGTAVRSRGLGGAGIASEPVRGSAPAVVPTWRVNLWSAGCSTGQEIYTLAMVLSEFGAQRGAFDFSLLGTDISSRVLQQAQTAIYDEELVEPVPIAWRQKYLLRSRHPGRAEVRIVPELRRRARFQPLNFMDASYPVGEIFDVIFFRNVMIYFDKPTQQAVVARMCERLRPGGYLFIGHSESLAGLKLPLQTLGPAIYRRL